MRLQSNLEIKLYNWLSEVVQHVGLSDVIFEYQNGVQPTDDHLVVSLISQELDSPPEVRYKDSIGLEREEYVVYRSTISVVLKVMSNNGAMLQAEHLKAIIWGSASTQLMQIQNIGLVSFGSTTNTSALSGPKFTQRADVNLLLSYTETYYGTSTDDQGVGGDTIGQVGVEGTNSETDEVIVDLTITDQ